MATRNQKRSANGRFYGGVRVRGFTRVNLVQKNDEGIDRVVGDSGWVENIITITGKMQYLALLLANTAGSKQVRGMAIGAGSTVASDATSLLSEIIDRSTLAGINRRTGASLVVATGSNNSTVTVQFAATWLSVESFATVSHTLGNIALMWSESGTGGSIFAGTNFGSSQLSTNQDVQASYVISFV
jgi:hypothetical protein